MITAIPADVEVRRSARRRKSVAAFRDGGRTIIVVPERMSDSDVARHANALIARLDRRAGKGISDTQLAARARLLRDRYLPGAPLPATITWSTRQRARWGSCTPSTESIRLSTRLRAMPQYVIDAVLLHELAHLLVADHGPRFKAIVNQYPEHDRAEAFLAGVEFAGTHGSIGALDALVPSDSR